MKNKTLLYSAFIALALAGCDYNEDNFEGFEELGKPTDVKKLEYTMTDADYATLSSNATNKTLAESEGVDKQLGYVKNDKSLSEAIPAAKYMPAFLVSRWPTADKGSSVKVTYKKSVNAPAYLATLSAAEAYEITPANYAAVWGETPVQYFTPAKPLSKYVTKFLNAAYADAQEGDVKVVNYKYSITEPNTGGASVAKEIDETFDSATESNKNAKTEVDGWLNIAEKGGKYWVNNFYNGGYTQCSAYGATEDAVTWLISPKVDLSKATAPKFAFDICLGYPNGAQLKVLVSDDFNGSDVNAATWTDLTTYFAFDASNAKYGKMSPAGSYDMSAFKGSPIHIAFKYIGNAKQTTTFQLDNIQLGDKVDVAMTDTYLMNFEAGADDWKTQIVKGTTNWTQKTFNNNSYMQCSAYKTTEEQEVYMVSPAIAIPAAGNATTDALMFDICIGSWNADCLSVLVSTDYAGDVTKAVTWDDVTSEVYIPQAPTSGYGTLGLCGLVSLKKYSGKTVYIAFKYAGNGADKRTTTVQIDNVRVVRMEHAASRAAGRAIAGRAVTGGTSSMSAIYTFDGSSWALYKNAIAVSADDYEEMGITTFSSTNKPENYLPQFLAKNYPYAQAEQAIGVIYTMDSKQTSAEYVYLAGAWNKNINVVTLTDQFVYNGSKWNYDPSVEITLPAAKGNTLSSSYYQTITDWVWSDVDQKEGISKKGDGYVTSYGNNEYYFGTSAYQNNIDFRPSAWKAQNAKAYSNMSDAELTDLMYKRLPDAFIPALEKLNSDANLVDGVDVTYTINFSIYGPDKDNKIVTALWQIVYKVTGKGKFAYVEGSLKQK